MSLSILTIEEEPEVEISYVPLSETENVEADMEVAHAFSKQDDLDLLQDSATALESIGRRIACEGMDINTARELEEIVPGFMRRSGGHGVFTNRPSLEGLSDTVKTVKDKFVEIIQHLRKAVAAMFHRFCEWLKAKFASKESQDTKEDVKDFLNKTTEANGLEFMAKLPEDPAQTAEEIGRLMDGDTKPFVAALTDKLGVVNKRSGEIEEMISGNPTHYRLAIGLTTVEQLFKEDLDSKVNTLIGKAFIAGGDATMARNADAFHKAMSVIAEISEGIDEFNQETVGSGDSGDQGESDSEVKLDKLYANISKAADDMQKVDVQRKAKDMLASLARIVRLSEEINVEDILEMIPDDVPASERDAFGQKIATFYRKLAKLGSTTFQLWKARSDSIANINKVGTMLMELKDSFEKAVVSAGAVLTPEQKTQLSTTMVGKGMRIDF
jgi:hypothetical protein